MMSFKQVYYKTTGYSYTHMGRMFLRLFIGLMLLQFGLRYLCMETHEVIDTNDYIFFFPISVIIIVEIFCSLCIMIGFLTRLMTIPPFVLMIISAVRFSYSIALMSLPFLFMGVYFFIFLVGPGKISIDYYLSLYLINRNNGNEADLEEV